MAKQKPPAVDPREMLRTRPRKTVTVSMCMGYDEADTVEQARKGHTKAVTLAESASKTLEDHDKRADGIDDSDPAEFSKRVVADKTRVALVERVDETGAAVTVAAVALAVAEEAADIVSVEFRLQSIGRVLVEQLRTAHPPTPTQKAQYGEMAAAAGLPKVQQIGPDWNPDTYPQAFLSAALIEPDWTAEEVDELIWSNEAVTQFERERLFHAAIEAQNVTNTVT